MKTLKTIGRFFEMCAYIVGVIGGIGSACYTKAYFIGACVAVLGAMAFPELKKAVKELISVDNGKDNKEQ